METEEPLLILDGRTKWEVFVRELNKLSYVAIPMVVVSVSQYLLRAVSMMMLGQLGELALSSAAIATSLSNVTGFSLLVSPPFPPYLLWLCSMALMPINCLI